MQVFDIDAAVDDQPTASISDNASVESFRLRNDDNTWLLKASFSPTLRRLGRCATQFYTCCCSHVPPCPNALWFMISAVIICSLALILWMVSEGDSQGNNSPRVSPTQSPTVSPNSQMFVHHLRRHAVLSAQLQTKGQMRFSWFINWLLR